jgi:hypothetical protein
MSAATDQNKRARRSHVWERDDLDQPQTAIKFDHRRAIEIGAAGEHLVCADLLLQGYRAFQASQGAPYDVVVDLFGRLVRITVKSTTGPVRRPGRPTSRGCYVFCIGRGKRDKQGKTSRRSYDAADVDVVALVALDTNQIAYIPIQICPQIMNLRADHGPERQNNDGPRFQGGNREFRDFPFSAALGATNGGE